MCLDLDRHKLVSRHLGHRHQDSLVQPDLANLGGHVFGNRPDCRDHLSSLFLKKLRVHETLIEAPSERGGELSSSITRFDDFFRVALDSGRSVLFKPK